MANVELVAERPVAGGRMLARLDGEVVLVSGTVPGERVRAKIERRGRGVIWARTIDVLEPGAARRDTTFDADCGGLVFAHVRYDDQLAFKAEIIGDAFRRIAKRPLSHSVDVAGSPETGYRLRARLHLSDGRAVFFREGSHSPCDPARTGQLRPETMLAVDKLLGRIGRDQVDRCAAVVVTENIVGTERLIHLEPAGDFSIDPSALTLADAQGSSVTTSQANRIVVLAGADHVVDAATDLFGPSLPPGLPLTTEWRHGPLSFFQGNRYLIGSLTAHVMASVTGDRIADCYAGVGLFGVALARSGRHVVAVEGDPHSADDLATNAGECEGRLDVRRAAVEQVLPSLEPSSFDTLIVDPPRTGLSDEAARALGNGLAPRVVYVSCDPATLARDAKRLGEAGYQLSALRAFDLFPNTAHVECVAVFNSERQQSRADAERNSPTP